MTIPRIGRLLRRVSLIAVCLMVAIGAEEARSGPTSVTPPTLSVQDLKSVDVADLAQFLFVNKQGREVARLQGIEDVVNKVQDEVMADVERGGEHPAAAKRSFVDRVGNGLKSVGTGIRNFLGPRPPSSTKQTTTSPPATSGPATVRPVSPGSWTSRPGMASAPAAMGGPRLTTHSPWAADMITTTSEEYQIGQIEAKIAGIMAHQVPIDAELDAKSAAEIERSITLLGKVVYAKTAVLSPPLGIHAHQPVCNNVILVERLPAGDDGILPPVRRPLIKFYEDITHLDNRDRMAEAVDDMTWMQESIRCISNSDMFAFEASYVTALIDTYEGLIRDNKKIMAYLLIDRSLPLVIQFADAVQWFQKPNGWKVFHLKKDPSDPGDEDPFALMRFLLVEHGGSSTLSHFGIWVENSTEDGRMKQARGNDFNIWTNFSFIQKISDPLTLGEGNCSFLEMSTSNNIPASGSCNFCCRPACDAMEKFRGLERGLDPASLGGIGVTPSTGLGAMMAMRPAPHPGGLAGTFGGGSPATESAGPPAHGDPGSEFTHFDTPRDQSQCSSGGGGGGGAPPSQACAGRAPQSSRGKLSPDQETDQMLNCTLSALAGAPRATVGLGTTDFRRNPFCKNQVGDKEVRTPPAEKTSTDKKITTADNTPRAAKAEDGTQSESERTMNDISNRVGRVLTRNDYMVNRFRDQVRRVYDRPDFSTEEARAALQVGQISVGKGRTVNVTGLNALSRDARDLSEGEGHGYSLGLTDNNGDGSSFIRIKEGLNSPEQLLAGLHETVHAALNFLEHSGRIEHISGSEASGLRLGVQSGQHQVTEAMSFFGGVNCGDSGKCSDSCGHEDMVMARFTECALAPGGGAPISGHGVVDPRGPRGPDGGGEGDASIPGLGGCFSPNTPDQQTTMNSCYAANCSGESGTGGSCCNGGGGGLGPPRGTGFHYATDPGDCGHEGERECDGPGPGGVPPIPMPGREAPQ